MKDKVSDSVEVSPSDYDPDKNYEKQLKHQRNFIERLNHWFRVITHPFILTILLIFLSIAFSVFHIMSKSTDIIWVKSAAELIGRILSYVATAVFSSMFTWFMENHSKLK